MLYDIFIAPFADFEFMRRALVGMFALSVGAPPIGVFLMLRRMSLIGDAMAHAILPGAAIGFLFAGLSLFAMAGGGLIAGLLRGLSLPRAAALACAAGAASTQASGGTGSPLGLAAILSAAGSAVIRPATR